MSRDFEGPRQDLRRPAPGRCRTDRHGVRVATTVLTIVIQTPAWAQSAAATPEPFAIGTLFVLSMALLALGVTATLLWRSCGTRHRLAHELHASRLQAQCLVQLHDDRWQWQSDAQHRITTMRPPAAAFRGDSAAGFGRELVWERFRTDDSALRTRLNAGAALDDLAVRYEGSGGGWRHGLLRARPLTDAAGVFAGYQGTLQDLPASAPAAGAPSAAHAAAPPAASGESDHESFSFTVSHDLRAPIRVVEGFAKILKEDYGARLDRIGNDHLDRVLDAARRMSDMTDALLALSQLSLQPMARQPVDLSRLAVEVAENLRRESPGRETQIEIEPGMQVRGDPTLLRVMLENLLGNAWKYSAKATRPSIVFARHANGADTFSVRDNGAGFDMRFSDRLFGVFQRLHSASDFAGTGVGLASVRRIVRRHGGEIWGEAEVNRGAQFHFSLPQRGASR